MIVGRTIDTAIVGPLGRHSFFKRIPSTKLDCIVSIVMWSRAWTMAKSDIKDEGLSSSFTSTRFPLSATTSHPQLSLVSHPFPPLPFVNRMVDSSSCKMIHSRDVPVANLSRTRGSGRVTARDTLYIEGCIPFLSPRGTGYTVLEQIRFYSLAVLYLTPWLTAQTIAPSVGRLYIAKYSHTLQSLFSGFMSLQRLLVHSCEDCPRNQGLGLMGSLSR